MFKATIQKTTTRKIMDEFDKLWKDFEEENAYEYPEQKEKIKSFLIQVIEKIK